MLSILLSHFSELTCTINGVTTTGDQCAGTLKAVGSIFIFIWLLLMAFGIVSFIFWVISLIHVIQHEDIKDRTMWIIIILLVPLGSWVYFFSVRKSYNKLHSSGQPVAPAVGTPPAAQPPVEPTTPANE